jgi:hypothetical protein
VKWWEGMIAGLAMPLALFMIAAYILASLLYHSPLARP